MLLPSENTALIKRPGMEKLFAAGVLPDELTKIALDQVKKAESGGMPQDHKKPGASDAKVDAEVLEKFLETEDAIKDIFMAFDRVTEMCVIQPEVRWHMRRAVDAQGNWRETESGKPMWEEIPQSERYPEGMDPNDAPFLYTDEVDQEDKTFIFNYVVGGTRDIEKFREEYSHDVATLRTGEDVDVQAE